MENQNRFYKLLLEVALIAELVCFAPDSYAQDYSLFQAQKDTLLNVETDTSKVIILKPIDIEVMVPMHHWEEEYYGVGQGYKSVNLLSYTIAYCVGRKETWLSKIGWWVYKYYNLKWEEIKEKPYFILEYDKFKPEIIRSER